MAFVPLNRKFPNERAPERIMLFDDEKSRRAVELLMSLPRLFVRRTRSAGENRLAPAADTVPATAAIDSLRARLRGDVATDKSRGMTAGVVAGDRLIWAEGFGYADRNLKKPAGVETVYRIGSVSKIVTAAALLRLVERGQVNLDDPIQEHLPEVRNFADAPPGSAAITLRHLATHTSGMIREPLLPDAASGPVTQWEEKILAAIPTASFDALPGARYCYSDVGYGVLGLAMSRLTGIPFVELIEGEIFRPLAMNNSTYVVAEERRHLLSKGYSTVRGGNSNADSPEREHLGRGYKVPSGGIYSTVADLARLVGALTGALGDVILNKESRSLMLARHTPLSGEGYGVGVWLKQLRGVTIAGHGGSVSGYTTHIAFEPQSGFGVILLRNYDTGRRNLVNVANETLLMLLGK